MKITLVLSIMICSFLIGYNYKNDIKKELELYKYLKLFIDNLKANINLFKSNIIEIIDNFLKNKNADFNKIFEKKQQIYEISSIQLKKILKNEQECLFITNYFSSLGANEYNFEINKTEGFEKYLESKIVEYENTLKNKGELFFKIALSVGAVIAILIW